MLIVLRILSILGILLLALVLLALTVLLLVLFVPVTYRIRAAKDGDGFRGDVKIRWMLGLFRADCSYPDPGTATVRLLFFPVFRMKIPPEALPEDAKEKPKRKKKREKKSGKAGKETQGIQTPQGQPESKKETVREEGGGGREPEETAGTKQAGEEYHESGGSTDIHMPEENTKGGKIFQKIKKIKYTITGIYDKIKKIWENISYYRDLLQEEETRLLFSHVLSRMKKVLKSLRPRRFHADILFGTGSPDKTGYLYGMYCIFAGALGKGFYVTPDFEQAIFRAEADAAGHITVWVMLFNTGKILLDRKLYRFIKKLKMEESGSEAGSRPAEDSREEM